MDITVNEQPIIELGDLIFIDDFVRGRIFQVASCNQKATINGYDRRFNYALYDLKMHSIYKLFETLKDLRKELEDTSYTVKNPADYEFHVRKKSSNPSNRF